MTLTSVKLTSRSSQLASRDVRWLHHRIADTFVPARGERVLWARPERTAVIVRSDGYATNPDMSWAEPVGIIPETDLSEGTRVTVTVIACPTRAARQPDGRRGRRTPLPAGPDAEAWIRRHLSDAIDVDAVTQEQLTTVWGHKADMTATIKRVRFAVAGRITNVCELDKLRRLGVGPGKAYGCGLVVVTR